jgi:cysteine desulfurase/selenocysteine lyase
MSTPDWNAVRTKFPVCNRLTYLNAAGGSPVCAEASIEGKRYFDEMLLYGDACWDQWLSRTEQVRDKLAAFIGASREEVAFMPNTSLAMGTIAQLLNEYGAVLTMEDEFPSSTIPWINLGYSLDFVMSESGSYSIKKLEKALRPEHKILVTSYVQYKTGFRQHLLEIGRFCRSANLLLVVNATQAFGVFPLDVARDQIDFLVFSGLKWACAGYGTAGLFISKKYLKAFKPPFAGWRSVLSPERMNNRSYDLKTETSLLEAGSPSFPAIFALGGALDLLSEIGVEASMQRIIYLSKLLERQLKENGYPVLYTFQDINRSGIIIVRTSNAKALVDELLRRNIMVSARGEGLRISVSIYNNEEDIMQLILALNSLKEMI